MCFTCAFIFFLQIKHIFPYKVAHEDSNRGKPSAILNPPSFLLKSDLFFKKVEACYVSRDVDYFYLYIGKGEGLYAVL